ncbi:MAG: sigma-54 dependent transcriptional regulator [Eubacteriaceae bacterium]|nr:sigma-54 dependent transcriptional regulator [Eubacteriaceae bacterium]
MEHEYGINRVLEPQYVLPTSAWRLDNSRKIASHEMRVNIERIHIEGTSFKQICLEANENEQKIKQKILDIVIRRGKLHNPVTDTGGLLCGTVAEIGEDYKNPKGFKVDDKIVCNASLASIPIYIDKILTVDRAFGQIEVEGYAILYDKIPLIPKPENMPTNMLLYVFNESGTLYRISSEAVGKKRFLLVGNNLLSNLLFGYAVRKVARDDAEIVCLLDKKTDVVLKGESIDALSRLVFNEIHYVDILKPLECLNKLKSQDYFDLSVNCADIPGAETINILATKSGGTVIFANLINNYNIALYITESVSKQLDIRCADGYLESYDTYDIDMVKDMVPYIEKAIETNINVDDDPSYPINRETRIMETSGMRRTLLNDFVCESRAMAMVLEEVWRVSKYDCNVLITGDSGVGKGTVASSIHQNSNRKVQPFVKVNCASLSPAIIESEFFGVEKDEENGIVGKKGYFELADKGTIFLNEIERLPLEVQAKLLRVVQDGEFFRVGGNTLIRTDVRILCATDGTLEDAVEKNRFRRDLYYQINVVNIKVPNLSERAGDMEALIRHMLKKYNEKYDMHRKIDNDALAYLKQCEWPGNIRQLETVIQRLMLSAKGEKITLLDVMQGLHSDVFGDEHMSVSDGDNTEKVMDLEKMVNNFEKTLIKHACEQYGSTRKVAKAIGISQTQLVRKKKKYDI